MKYIDSIINFEKIANRADSSEFMLTSMAGCSYYPIDGRIIEAVICSLKKRLVPERPEVIQLTLQLKDIKSYDFESEVTTINLIGKLVTDDVAHGYIEGYDAQVVFIKQSPIQFSLLLLADDAEPDEHISQKLINGDEDIKAELEQLRQKTREVPNIFDAYTEMDF